MMDPGAFRARKSVPPAKCSFRRAKFSKARNNALMGVAPKGDHPIFVVDFKPVPDPKTPNIIRYLVRGLMCSRNATYLPDGMALFNTTLYELTTCFDEIVHIDSRDIYEQSSYPQNITEEMRCFAAYYRFQETHLESYDCQKMTKKT